MKEKLFKTLSDRATVQIACACDGRLYLKLAPETGKARLVDGGKVERRNSKLVGGSRPESLPGWHISDTGEV